MKDAARAAKIQPWRLGALALLAAAGMHQLPAAAQEPFRIGLVTLPGEAAEVEGLTRIRAAYSGAVGLPVEVIVARDYTTLAQAHIDGRLDYAIYSAMAYVATMQRCNCLVPLASPIDTDGATGLHTVLIVRTDGPGAKGRLAVGPADSLTTRLAALALSEQAQAALTEGRLVEAESAAGALALFAGGEVDGFFGWEPATDAERSDNGTLGTAPAGTKAQLAAAGLEASSWRIAWRSDLLRYGPHAVRNDMEPARMKRLSGLLAGAFGGDIDLGARLDSRHGGRFDAVTAADYEPVRQALTALGQR